MDQAFETADTNHDGVLDRAEWAAAQLKASSSRGHAGGSGMAPWGSMSTPVPQSPPAPPEGPPPAGGDRASTTAAIKHSEQLPGCIEHSNSPPSSVPAGMPTVSSGGTPMLEPPGSPGLAQGMALEQNVEAAIRACIAAVTGHPAGGASHLRMSAPASPSAPAEPLPVPRKLGGPRAPAWTSKAPLLVPREIAHSSSVSPSEDGTGVFEDGTGVLKEGFQLGARPGAYAELMYEAYGPDAEGQGLSQGGSPPLESCPLAFEMEEVLNGRGVTV